jgi:hypothetical protein
MKNEFGVVMKKNILRWLGAVVIVALVLATLYIFSSPMKVQAQQPTGSIPTVTGTPSGVIASVREDEPKVNVRSGPGYFWDPIGVLLVGQSVPVIGKTAAGEWLLVQYPGVPGGQGWVFAAFMSLTRGTIPIVESPPQPSPKVTSTIDPTMAAEFIRTPIPTRLPTYTAPAPISIPTYQDPGSAQRFAGIPVGFIILILAGLGIMVGVATIFQNR